MTYGRMPHCACGCLVALLLASTAPAWPPQATTDDPPARHVDPRADDALKRMSELLRKLPRFTLSAVHEYDLVTELGQKILMSRQMTIRVERPRGLVVRGSGDDGERAYIYDGRSFTVVDYEGKMYSRVQAPDTIDRMLDLLAERYGLSVPTADLVGENAYATLMADVTQGVYVGISRIGSAQCHHLAFVQPNLDWQIWIADSDKPYPLKLVLTYKLDPGSPQFIARMDAWNLEAAIDPRQFDFQPPKDFNAAPLEPLSAQGATTAPASAPAGGAAQENTHD